MLMAAGCGSRRPSWLGGRSEPPIIPPKSTAPLPGAESAPASAPAKRRESPPVDVSPAAESKTLSQAAPGLLGDTVSDEPLSLTDLQSLGGDLPWTGAAPDALSSRLSRTERDGPRIEYRPRLAPLPEPEPAEAPPAIPSPPPPREVESGSPDDLRSRLTVADEKDVRAERPQPIRKRDEPHDRKRPAPAELASRTVPERTVKPLVLDEEEIVAGTTLQINNQNVSVDDILGGLHRELADIPTHVSKDRFREMAASIIAREMAFEAKRILMYTEADKLLEEGVKKQIDIEMEETRRDMIAHAAGSIETLKARIRREGTTLEAVLKEQQRELTVRYYMQVKFGPAIIVNRRMLWNYYRQHKNDFVVEREVQMQIIAAPYRRFLPAGVIDPTDEEIEVAKAEAKQTIESALAKLQAGEDFGDVAKQYSRGLRAEKGGVWPMMGAGNFRNSRVEKEAFTLPEGKHSGIIEGKDGDYIVKAMKVKPGKITPFIEAQASIEQTLRDRQYDKLSFEYMDKLFKNAAIDAPPEFIALAVERAVERYKGSQ